VSNYVFYRLAVTQPGPGAEGVLDMGCQRVSTFVQYRGNTALGVKTGPLVERGLGNERNPGVAGELQGQA
jgi:hypothetical protein